MARRQAEIFARVAGWMVIAIAALLPLPASADVPLHGTFTANAACPALASMKKGTNPGNVTLVPQQGYQAVSANNTPASHYLLIVPGAEPDRRWVEIGCGTLAAGATATTPVAPPAAPARIPAGPPNRSPAGAPTHYVLSLSWEPGFCAGHDGKPECAAETPQSFEASHFTLHGLWPDPREYCGASAADIAADKAGRWNNLPAVELSTATRARLAEGMPGTQSLLERHEWIKHGTCSGVDADTYFGRALDFLAAVNGSPVQAAFAARLGDAIDGNSIRDAFSQGFGAGAGDRVRISCDRNGGNRLITEITVGLEGDVVGRASLKDLVANARPTNAGCDSGIVQQVQ